MITAITLCILYCSATQKNTVSVHVTCCYFNITHSLSYFLVLLLAHSVMRAYESNTQVVHCTYICTIREVYNQEVSFKPDIAEIMKREGT